MTPLTALKVASWINEAGFPPGSLNIVNGYGADKFTFLHLRDLSRAI